MFKKIVALAMATALTIGLTACGGGSSSTSDSASSESTTESTSETSDSGEESEFDGNFVVGFDAEFPPFGYMNDAGEYVGFDLELAEEVANRNGWEFTAQPINWDAKDMELDSGNIACIWNGFTMTGRENEYTWSVPYIDSSIIVAVRKDSEIKTLADLAGKNVMVQADSSGLSALEDEENAELTASFGNLEQIGDYNSAFMNLEAGAVDAIVVDIGVGLKQINAKPDVFTQLDEAVTTEQYAVGFKKGNESLRDMVEATLFEMLDDGTFDKIAANYAEDQIPDMVCLDQQR